MRNGRPRRRQRDRRDRPVPPSARRPVCAAKGPGRGAEVPGSLCRRPAPAPPLLRAQPRPGRQRPAGVLAGACLGRESARRLGHVPRQRGDARRGGPDRVRGSPERADSPEQAAAWSAGTPTAWANEMHRVAVEHAYADITADGPPPKITDEYVKANTIVVERQLQRAGVRLASVLDEAFGGVPTTGPATTRPATTRPATQPVEGGAQPRRRPPAPPPPRCRPSGKLGQRAEINWASVFLNREPRRARYAISGRRHAARLGGGWDI